MAQRMPAPDLHIVSAPAEVADALGALGLDAKMVERIGMAAISARADTLRVDAAAAPGSFAYFYGVRQLRLELLRAPGDWRMSREGNVESVVSDHLALQLIFQNVDRACDFAHEPQAISAKGAECRRQIAAGQGELFPRAARGRPVHGAAPCVWVVCVEASVKHLRIELSCPRAFDGSRFHGFVQRIFVVAHDPSPIAPALTRTVAGSDTLDVVVNRKR